MKASGRPDLALIVADRPLACAGVFTTNAAAAAPVALARETLAQHELIRAVVINSGNANALTGPRGRADARAMKDAVERWVGAPALVLSTGVIGVPLPLEAVLVGIERAAGALRPGAEDAVAHAILTTDTRPKTASTTFVFDGRDHRVGGVAKGSGMIHPHMATMLAVMATDAPVTPAALRALTPDVVDRSFHEISVDGDTSTNDAVLVLAPPAASGPSPAGLQEAFTRVAQDLARQIVEDGEGATRVMEVRVRGLPRAEDARRVARTIATSSLVKTALAGGDPNWGRILAAAGRAGVAFGLEDVSLTIAGIDVFRAGGPLPFDVAALRAAVHTASLLVVLDFGGEGGGTARMLTSDLTRRYVEINADYTT
ncbi:MAG: bifunctional glutamate N-acetyltransferase/amino-acid acetyltransferase ArgJ [Myxococcota bacterium]